MSAYDREDNMIHVHEREEARDAARFAPPYSCQRHNYQPNGRGGGDCQCGDSIGADEL